MADEPSKEESAVSTTTEASPPEAEKIAPTKACFSIWPPSERTREAIVQRLITTLSSPSIISKRYGVIPAEEASDLAKGIEEESFACANPTLTTGPDDDGTRTLQMYSQEISRRMLDTVKARSGSVPLYTAAAPLSTAAAPAEVAEEPGAEVAEEPVASED